MQKGEILTIDIERMHNVAHPRIEFVIGSSVSSAVVAKARQRAAAIRGPVMVILDSNHSAEHVFKELELYAPLVTPGSFVLVEDGVVDTLPMFRQGRPGPLPAIKRFLESHADFEVDVERSERFLITHHPQGWLRRVEG
jgi:cephalosporin hydroxylase